MWQISFDMALDAGRPGTIGRTAMSAKNSQLVLTKQVGNSLVPYLGPEGAQYWVDA